MATAEVYLETDMGLAATVQQDDITILAEHDGLTWTALLYQKGNGLGDEAKPAPACFRFNDECLEALNNLLEETS